MAVTFPILSQRFKWELPGDIQCSRLASFEGMRKCKWLGVNVNDAMIRNLSFTLEDTTESAAKAECRCPTIILNSLAKVVHGNGIALGYLLAEQEGVCAVANTTC